MEAYLSDWRPVTNGVSGSVLGQLLFVFYIYNLDGNIQGPIGKCADYTQIGSIRDSEDGYQELLGYFLISWAGGSRNCDWSLTN